MDGAALIRALKRLNPRVKIIAASGLAPQDQATEAALKSVEIFLSKPYTAEKLLRALAQALHHDSVRT